MAYYPAIGCVLISASGVRTPAAALTFTAYNLTTAAALGSVVSDADGIISSGTFGADGDLVRLTHATYSGIYRFNLRSTQALAYTTQGDHGLTYVVQNLQTPSPSKRATFIAIDTNSPNAVPIQLGDGESGTTTQLLMQQGPVARALRIYPISQGKDGGATKTDYGLQTTQYRDVTIPATPPKTIKLFQHFVDATTALLTAQTLYSYTLPAATLTQNGDTIKVEYGGIFTANVNTKRIQPKFAGTILATGQAAAAATDWSVDYYIIRVSNTVVRFVVEFTSTGETPTVESGEITGLNLTTTAYGIDLDGRTITTAGELIAQSGYGIFHSAA